MLVADKQGGAGGTCAQLRLRSLLAGSRFALPGVARRAVVRSGVPGQFPDAFVLPHGSRFIAYSTNNGPNVPIAISTDLVHWDS